MPWFSSMQAILLYSRSNSYSQSSRNSFSAYPILTKEHWPFSIVLVTADYWSCPQTTDTLRDNIFNFFCSVFILFLHFITNILSAFHHQHSRTASVVVIFFAFFPPNSFVTFSLPSVLKSYVRAYKNLSNSASSIGSEKRAITNITLKWKQNKSGNHL